MKLDFQDVAALITLLTGFYIAITNRNSSAASAQMQAVESASKSIELREKDIQILEKKLDKLENYIRYLLEWIKLHSDAKEVIHPLTLDEFEIENPEDNNGTN